jgi:hypothetical protein
VSYLIAVVVEGSSDEAVMKNMVRTIFDGVLDSDIEVLQWKNVRPSARRSNKGHEAGRGFAAKARQILATFRSRFPRRGAAFLLDNEPRCVKESPTRNSPATSPTESCAVSQWR